MNSVLLLLQLAVIFVIVHSKTIINNEEDFEQFLKTSKMSRESKEILREYQKEGKLSFPFDPFNLINQVQSMFSQLPTMFSSIFRFPFFFFNPADIRMNGEKTGTSQSEDV